MAFPYSVFGHLTTLAGAIDLGRPDRTVAMIVSGFNRRGSASAKGRWSVGTNTTVKLNVQNTDASGTLASVTWAIVAKRVR